jgi:hypothetical protein
MRATCFRMMFLMLFTLLAVNAWTLVSEYSFSSTLGTYNEITGGTVLGSTANDDESFNAIPLGFTFTYNGVWYSMISIQTDGFLAFGPTVLNSTLAISSATGTNNVVSALNRDLMSRTDGELSYLLTGSEPNRVFVVQWKNYRRIPSTASNDVFNFQIQLHESSNWVDFSYGTFSLVTVSTAATVQVGMRGDSNTDFNNRTTTTNWSATTAGTAANASCTINANVYPPNGLTFSFFAVQPGPPLPAQILYPTDNEMNVNNETNLSWISGGGLVDGYRVFLGTDNPPANIVNGTTQTGTVYNHPVNLGFGTQYYWQIVPYNTFGDAVGCPVWTFTTMADPTITVYPYLQTFDTLTTPNIPMGWTVLNTNTDSYTWVSVADANANSAPNAMRIRYNDSIAMNDWLITPPLQFTAGSLMRISFYYRGGSSTFTEKLSLYLGDSPTADALTTQLFVNNNITSTVYEMAEILLPIPTSGVKYLGFKGFSDAGMYQLFLDTFSLQEVAPAFAIDPVTHDFGDVNVGESASQNFNISNSGGGILTINAISISGSPMLSLSSVPALPVSLGIGATCSFTVVFAPTAAGMQTATVTVSDALTRVDHPIAVTGNGFLNEAFNPPTNLAAVVTGNDVHLTWSAPVSRRDGMNRNLLGYKVFRDTTLIVTITDPGTLFCDDLDLDQDDYSYTVTAYYTSGESVPAGPVTVTILEQLYPPTDLEAQVVENDVTLSWTSPYPPTEGEWITWANDVYGNSVGTNEAAQFIVAQRWDQTDLAPYQGDTILRVKFMPSYSDCVYTVKIWTGGSALDPGTLMYSQVAENLVMEEWNQVILTEAVPIPAAGDLWVGYAVDTQGGFPAAVDFGPAIDGKGNMMFFNGAWTTLSNLSSTLVCNWLIEAFVAEGNVRKHNVSSGITEYPVMIHNTGTLAYDPDHRSHPIHATRSLNGFKIYRDGALIANLNDTSTFHYTDMNLANGDYLYGVKAVYTNGDSQPVTLNVNVTEDIAPTLFSDSFESYGNFVMAFAPWTLLDIDQSITYGINDVNFPGNEAQSAFMVFNPGAVVPPQTNMPTFEGNKMLACFADTAPPNNDWMITPRIMLGTGSTLRFYAKSFTSLYGLERFRVGVSVLSSIVPEGFQYITGVNAVETPTEWTEYTYDISGYDNQNVYIGIRCVSNDAFLFFVDKFSVFCTGGSVPGEDQIQPVLRTELKGNYPNPFNPSTTIRYSIGAKTPVSIDIYNSRGQLVRSLVNDVKDAGEHTLTWNGKDEYGRALASGLYLIKMRAGGHVSMLKSILMK